MQQILLHIASLSDFIGPLFSPNEFENTNYQKKIFQKLNFAILRYSQKAIHDYILILFQLMGMYPV